MSAVEVAGILVFLFIVYLIVGLAMKLSKGKYLWPWKPQKKKPKPPKSKLP